ncbi:GPW/gp25 family protein [Candidatus Tokpelaia sp.]|uniref:GPW/gp25 family protein n=1 Tax=Candidatus Tokpelaia sp. TaxID=2233777 RepID=UPI00123B3344|nr:baseplate assembly protein [Candidatus Tokpelaia sp.]KAA6405667.1 baseplate assembly protein [Candidatus Tokpelaia sp.]
MRCGVSAKTGQLIYDWEHCLQSIDKCLTTRIGSRVLRRHLGADVPAYIDANGDENTIMHLFQAITQALDDPVGGEPGFSLQKIEMVQAGRDGAYHFVMNGIFYPNGHLGDWSLKQEKVAIWPN